MIYIRYKTKVFKLNKTRSKRSWSGYYYNGKSPEGEEWYSMTLGCGEVEITEDEYNLELIRIL